MREIKRSPKVLILRMRYVPTIDASGIQALEDIVRKVEREGTVLIICGVHSKALEVMKQSGMIEKIGLDNFQPTLDQALDRAKTRDSPQRNCP